MKTTLQLSIDIELKQRLINISTQTGIPIAKIMDKLIREYLPEEEKKHNIQLTLEGTQLASPLKINKVS